MLQRIIVPANLGQHLAQGFVSREPQGLKL